MLSRDGEVAASLPAAPITNERGSWTRLDFSTFTGEASGAKVVLVDRDETAVREAADRIGRQSAMAIVADVSRHEEVQAAIDEVVRRWGRIDLLHNHAGMLDNSDGSILDVNVDVFRHTLNVNVVGQMLVAQACARVMVDAGEGAIVNTSSDLALVALPGVASYVTSKAAIAGLTRSMAVDLAPFGIRVNAVCPGFIETEMTAEMSKDVAAIESMRDQYLVRSLGRPEDVAHAVLFLLSADARFITGSCLVVDGGHTVM